MRHEPLRRLSERGLHWARDAAAFASTTGGSLLIAAGVFFLLAGQCPPFDLGNGQQFTSGARCVGDMTFEEWMQPAAAVSGVLGFIAGLIAEQTAPAQ